LITGSPTEIQKQKKLKTAHHNDIVDSHLFKI